VIHPGLTGGTEDHWYRWKKKLSTARRVTQRLDRIVARRMGGHADARRRRLRASVVVIAHSLGVITTLHAAPRSRKVASAFSLRAL
jgi:predicted alpha/beta hydrolase family esterase